MLAAYVDSEQNSCFQLLGTKSLLGSSSHESETAISLLSSEDANGNIDFCNFAALFSEPSEAALMSFAESCESCGSVAYSNSSESCGSIAFSGSSESCGSIASSSASCGSCCSYSC